jgi:hypothetical protein
MKYIDIIEGGAKFLLDPPASRKSVRNAKLEQQNIKTTKKKTSK